MDRPKYKKDWHDALYSLLRRHNVTQFAYVPDAGHQVLIAPPARRPPVHSLVLTTEDSAPRFSAAARINDG